MSLTFKFSASYLTSLLKTSLTQFPGFPRPPPISSICLFKKELYCLSPKLSRFSLTSYLTIPFCALYTDKYSSFFSLSNYAMLHTLNP